MVQKLPRLLIAAVVALALTIGSAIGATGYIDQSQIKISLSGPSRTVKCNRPVTITATVRSTESGKRIWNQTVRWSLPLTQSSADGLSSYTTVTNKKGETSVKLIFGPVAGARRVSAAAGKVSPATMVRCAGGLPKTSALPPDGYIEQPGSALLVPPTVTEPAPAVLPATGLRLDRLGIDLGLVEGDGVTVPEGAAAHYPGTAWPGEISNTYIYAHAREGHFLELWRVRSGDLVEMDMADGSVASYRVTEIHPVVEWDALEYLAPSSSERLTLQTCLTYDDTAPRFIVIAEPVSSA